tara:strand:+ start:2590 stop:3477 length:888 start_codon:yes stop_codon:yes gene_type:complete
MKKGFEIKTTEDLVPHFRIEGPAMISCSGGRTSMMLTRLIQLAHGGELPEDIIPVFSNTGMEFDQTLDFVHDAAEHWSLPIHWVERDPSPEGSNPKWKVRSVNWEGASRKGEPFERLIRERKYLPNVATRYCTQSLKISPMRHHMLSLGWTDYYNVLGLRYDEPHRVHRVLERNDNRKDGYEVACPLFDARVTIRDVERFWSEQGFDLQLRPHESNCNLCYLKGEQKLMRIMRDHGGVADWWMRMEGLKLSESSLTHTFSSRRSYADLLMVAESQLELFPVEELPPDIQDCFCHD